MTALVHQLLGARARRQGEATALIAADGTFTYQRLDRASDALAWRLGALGVRPGERVALMLENSAAWVVAFFGVLKSGAVHVPVPPATRPAKLAYILNDAGARALIAGREAFREEVGALAEALADVPSLAVSLWVGDSVPPLGHALSFADTITGDPPPPPDPGIGAGDLAAILYTSGTTGEPKGVMLTHANLASTAASIAGYLGNHAGDVVGVGLPLSFGYGLSQVTTAALAGFTLALERSLAYPADTVNRFKALGVTGLPGVPALFAALVQMDPAGLAEWTSLRYLTNAAAPLPVAHLRRLTELFPRADFHSMYGMTEASTRIATLDPARLADKIASVGKAIPGSEAFVADERGHPLPAGVTGELVVRGPNVMAGYWRRPGDTARRLRGGWLRTGDLFTSDAEGFLTFVARQDDVFKCRGEKVAPKEVESVLHDLDGVAEAAVVGVPHPIDGTAVKAVVVPKAGHTLREADIRRHCRARLEPHLNPRFVEIRAALPKTPSGKLKRGELAQAG